LHHESATVKVQLDNKTKPMKYLAEEVSAV